MLTHNLLAAANGTVSRTLPPLPPTRRPLVGARTTCSPAPIRIPGGTAGMALRSSHAKKSGSTDQHASKGGSEGS